MGSDQTAADMGAMGWPELLIIADRYRGIDEAPNVKRLMARSASVKTAF